MKNDSYLQSRRSFIQGTVGATTVVALAGLGMRAANADSHAPKLKLDDPRAKALAYTEQSEKDGQWCMNCQLYTGKDGDSYGPCAIFPGVEVAAKGWCSSWVKKAG